MLICIRMVSISLLADQYVCSYPCFTADIALMSDNLLQTLPALVSFNTCFDLGQVAGQYFISFFASPYALTLISTGPSDGALGIASFCSLHSLQSLSLENYGFEVDWWATILRNLNIPTLLNVDFYQSEITPDPDGAEADRVTSLAFADFFSRHPQLTVAKVLVPSAPIRNFNQPDILPNLLTFRGHLLEVLALLQTTGSRRLKEVDFDDVFGRWDGFAQPLVNPSNIELETLCCGSQILLVSQTCYNPSSDLMSSCAVRMKK